MSDFDVILVGGGLANGLIASRLQARRPQLRVLVVEAGDRLGGNHTWSFHASDVAPAHDRFLAAFAPATWTRQEVAFPAFRRTLATGYRALSSEALHRHVSALPSVSVALGSRVVSIEEGAIVLDGGRSIQAPCVIDGRGLGGADDLALGYQKFVGLEIELREPHGLDRPVIMDATVPQLDGYRFLYSLPLAPTRLLVEDTYYADQPELDRSALSERVLSYAAAKGWHPARIVREEAGVLPIVLDGALEALWPSSDRGKARSGMRSGLFHQTTGYSLPHAAVAADSLAASDHLTTAVAARIVRDLAESNWRSQSFFRMLNRLLFIAAAPARRVDVMQRFYRLGEPLIERFYAGRLTILDKARILSGNPPVPVVHALRAMDPRAADGLRARPRPAAAVAHSSSDGRHG
ncbi:MAG: lycopene beta-cyclase CrtY [Hyphomicrobiaceae bacterium]